MSPAVATVPLPNESEVPGVATPISKSDPVVTSVEADVEFSSSKDAGAVEVEVKIGVDAAIARTPELAALSNLCWTCVVTCRPDLFLSANPFRLF